MKLEAGKTYKTRGGGEAKVFYVFDDSVKCSNSRTVFGAYKVKDYYEDKNYWIGISWYTNGKYLKEKSSEFDIVLPIEIDEGAFEKAYTSIYGYGFSD